MHHQWYSCTSEERKTRRLPRIRILERRYEWFAVALPAKLLYLVGKEREVVQIEEPCCVKFMLYALVLVSGSVV